jgi:apolipoprotein N-acyltransferase
VHGLSVPKGRGVRVIGLWALTFVLAGVSNAIFYVPINRSEYHSMIFMGIALFYSAWVILLFRPKSDVSHRAEPPAKQDSNRK